MILTDQANDLQKEAQAWIAWEGMYISQRLIEDWLGSVYWSNLWFDIDVFRLLARE